MKKDPEILKIITHLNKDKPEDKHIMAELLLMSIIYDDGEWDKIEGDYLVDEKAKEAYIKAIETCAKLKRDNYLDFKYSAISEPYEYHFIDITLKPNDIVLEIPTKALKELLATTLKQNDKEGKFLTIKKENPLQWSLSYKIYYEAS